jgi:hypothetical protein
VRLPEHPLDAGGGDEPAPIRGSAVVAGGGEPASRGAVWRVDRSLASPAPRGVPRHRSPKVRPPGGGRARGRARGGAGAHRPAALLALHPRLPRAVPHARLHALGRRRAVRRGARLLAGAPRGTPDRRRGSGPVRARALGGRGGARRAGALGGSDRGRPRRRLGPRAPADDSRPPRALALHARRPPLPPTSAGGG